VVTPPAILQQWVSDELLKHRRARTQPAVGAAWGGAGIPTCSMGIASCCC
jgi:hypothetical protein